jgi:hypothetical protein
MNEHLLGGVAIVLHPERPSYLPVYITANRNAENILKFPMIFAVHVISYLSPTNFPPFTASQRKVNKRIFYVPVLELHAVKTMWEWYLCETFLDNQGYTSPG